MENAKKAQLLERINHNFLDFKASLRGVSRTNLFDMAPHIAAVTEAHEILTTEYPWDEEEEINFFLLFRNPLTIIADAWENRRNDMAIDFEDAMFDISGDDRIIALYPLMEGVADDIFYDGDPDEARIRFQSEL